MATQTHTIRQLCDEFDVTPRTLRFYEAKGLLEPIRQGQRRLFTQRDRARLILILRGKRFGFSLAEIKDLLELYNHDDDHVSQISATLAAAKRHHAELLEKRRELDEAIAELEQQMTIGEKMLTDKSIGQVAE
ncbi:MAG: MerR family DNA-binding transcriptional regulator [Pseudomonadota bacterium]